MPAGLGMSSSPYPIKISEDTLTATAFLGMRSIGDCLVPAHCKGHKSAQLDEPVRKGILEIYFNCDNGAKLYGS